MVYVLKGRWNGRLLKNFGVHGEDCWTDSMEDAMTFGSLDGILNAAAKGGDDFVGLGELRIFRATRIPQPPIVYDFKEVV